MRAAHCGLDALDELVAGVDIDTRGLVRELRIRGHSGAEREVWVG